MKKPKLVVLTGAGISAESGLKTFRDSDGLWEGHRVEDVATPEAWRRDPERVQRFYNERRKAVLAASPNAAHIGIANLETYFEVHIITQNIDNLHERAGSTNILHLHGEIIKARSEDDSETTYLIEGDTLTMSDRDPSGNILRPHIVWFGESVPEFEKAVNIAQQADYFVVVGTSLVVYPAASVVHYVQPHVPILVLDPRKPLGISSNVEFIESTAVNGIEKLTNLLLNKLHT